MFGWFKKRGAAPHGPDFSAVDTKEKAARLCRRGDLERLLLVPLEFGGADHENNVIYVPVGVGALKSEFDLEVVLPAARAGKLTQYEAVPTYQGNSVVPTAIRVVASDPGRVTSTFRIWGDALAEQAGA